MKPKIRGTVSLILEEKNLQIFTVIYIENKRVKCKLIKIALECLHKQFSDFLPQKFSAGKAIHKWRPGRCSRRRPASGSASAAAGRRALPCVSATSSPRPGTDVVILKNIFAKKFAKELAPKSKCF
jgi:hypothetical protein